MKQSARKNILFLNRNILIKAIFMVTSLALTWCYAVSQTSPSADTNIAVAKNSEISVSNPPPNLSYHLKPHSSHFMSSDEYGLSLLVLAFGIAIFLLQFFLIRQGLFDSNQSVRITTITLVIIASLFLISAGFSSDQITPIIGLLGTIVGYLLGTNQSSINKN